MSKLSESGMWFTGAEFLTTGSRLVDVDSLGANHLFLSGALEFVFGERGIMVKSKMRRV